MSDESDFDRKLSVSSVKSDNWIYITPLAAAPLLGLSRIFLKNHPRQRNLVFGGLIAIFLAHGAILINYADTKKK